MPDKTHSEIRIVDGESFLISDPLGNINRIGINGFFYRDTRFLSECNLSLNNNKLTLLSANKVDHFLACHYSTTPCKSIFESHPVTVIRNRVVGNGVIEEIILQNYVPKPLNLTLDISFDADFSDVMQVRQGMKAKGKTSCIIDKDNQQIIFEYKVDEISRKSILKFKDDVIINNKSVTFNITVPAKGEWTTSYTLSLLWEGILISPESDNKCNICDLYYKSHAYKTLKNWQNFTPKLSCNYNPLDKFYEQSLNDFEALKIHLDIEKNIGIAAGMPWYQTPFGRDSMISSYQYSFISPEKGLNVLRNLARYQGKEYNDFRDEEPGKIMHELRFGEETLLGNLPYNPYYGASDGPALYIILLYEIYNWTGNKDIVNELKEPALKALDWMDKYGDIDGDGYVEYKRRSSKGLNTQCWKDSDISIIFSNGTLAEPPIAAVEVQGYVYDAKVKLAVLAEEVWSDYNLAEKLKNESKILKEKFNKDFWIEDKGGYFALALDKNKKKVDSLTSNIGQLLWSGIVDNDKAGVIAKQLMNDSLFSGWGVRTMSDKDMGYNPIEYHNGSIWPHDNSLIAYGLAKYGYRDEANQIIMSLIKASTYFDNRLPELFAGYRKKDIYDFPVIYPHSAYPQAWASGSCMLFLRTILGLESDSKNRALKLNPYLPAEIENLELKNIKLYGKTFSVNVSKSAFSLEEIT